MTTIATGSGKYAPQQRYDAANTTQLKLKLNTATDADILAHLDNQDSKQGYIKALIRADIASSKARATELITTLKSMLPEGLEAIVIKDIAATGYIVVDVCFCYQGMEKPSRISCTTAHASFDKMECGSAISTAMVYFAEQLRDRDMEAYWRRSCYPPVGK